MSFHVRVLTLQPTPTDTTFLSRFDRPSSLRRHLFPLHSSEHWPLKQDDDQRQEPQAVQPRERAGPWALHSEPEGAETDPCQSSERKNLTLRERNEKAERGFAHMPESGACIGSTFGAGRRSEGGLGCRPPPSVSGLRCRNDSARRPRAARRLEGGASPPHKAAPVPRPARHAAAAATTTTVSARFATHSQPRADRGRRRTTAPPLGALHH